MLNFTDLNIILASKSPRRQELLQQLNIPFTVKLKTVNESYPNNLKHAEISNYLAKLKAKPYLSELKKNDLLLTSDTIVWHNNKALGKPNNENEATAMLKALSNNTHEVITSVCFTTIAEQHTVFDTTHVTFEKLSEVDINFYVKTKKPFDKAGAYGIQDWIGLARISSIKGSYFTVMGLPTHLIYKYLSSRYGLS